MNMSRVIVHHAIICGHSNFVPHCHMIFMKGMLPDTTSSLLIQDFFSCYASWNKVHILVYGNNLNE